LIVVLVKVLIACRTIIIAAGQIGGEGVEVGGVGVGGVAVVWQWYSYRHGGIVF